MKLLCRGSGLGFRVGFMGLRLFALAVSDPLCDSALSSFCAGVVAVHQEKVHASSIPATASVRNMLGWRLQCLKL